MTSRLFRLYHNDVLIPWGLKEGQKPPSREIKVPVRLVPNRNRFYVMASQDGAFDSRSEEVVVDYVGPMEPGRLHVIALGVGEYQKRRLQYAQRNAERLSEVLYERGLDKAGQAGLRRLLPDTQVTRKNVERPSTTSRKPSRTGPRTRSSSSSRAIPACSKARTSAYCSRRFRSRMSAHPGGRAGGPLRTRGKSRSIPSTCCRIRWWPLT